MRNNWGLTLLGAFLAIAIIVSTIMVSRTLLEIKQANQIVEVKGFAEKRILSDWALWRGRFTSRGTDLVETSSVLERQRGTVLAFLKKEGIQEEELEVSPVITQVLYQHDEKGRVTNTIEGYALSINFTVSAGDIDRVARVAKASDALIKQDIQFSSQSPQYFYTKLSDLKISMLGEATADARRRAEQLAEKSGSSIGSLRFARQGVFQITPAYSTEVSNFGQNDTSSREKSIKAVVTIGYTLGD
jgi:hypothetical protein